MLQAMSFRSTRTQLLLLMAACLPSSLCGALHGQQMPPAAPVSTAWNPWQEQHSTVTEALRGIHAVGNGVAWASGAHGTVLRTEDSGFVWQRCSMPPGAAGLDFRSVWAWNAQTAMVLSSGAGKKSRLYKTTDGCGHWKLLFTNTDADGFFDGMAFSDAQNGYILGDPAAPLKGDPANRRFVVLRTDNGGQKWTLVPSKDLSIGSEKLGAFAASNQAMVLTEPVLGAVAIPWFGTSGASGASSPFVYVGGIDCTMSAARSNPRSCLNRDWSFDKQAVPLAGGSESAGIFALGLRLGKQRGEMHAVAVGGDYSKPESSQGTAAYRDIKTGKWMAAARQPHGYRSSVAWDAASNAWIAVGPNGSDVSYDDGQNWTAIGHDGYNALSLPWVVGANGRIAKLQALKGK